MSRNTFYPGVVSPSQFAIGTHEGPRVIIAHTEPRASALLRLAHFYHLNTVWVAPGNELSHVDPLHFCNADPEEWDVKYKEIPTSASRLARMQWAIAWRKHGTFDEKRTIKIIFIEQSQWNWEETDPLILLTAIQDLQKTLALPIEGHPGGVGRELMKWMIPRDCYVVPHIDLDQLEGAKCARDFAWKRPITEAGQYLHAYDKNSMYLSAAASSCSLGIGDPQYYCAENMKEPDIRHAGIWRISAEPKDTSVGHAPKEYPLSRCSHKLPWPLANEQEWCTAPILKVLRELGARVQIFEGYEWNISRRALGKWAEQIWDVRQHYSEDMTPSGRVCYQSMKRIATASIGLLASEKGQDKAWYRPDWWSTIIETAKARVMYNIDHYGKEWHIWPAMVHVDCLYYVSDSPEPDKRLLAREKELGGYKHHGCWPIDEEVLGWFADPDKTSGDMVRLLRLREEAAYAR